MLGEGEQGALRFRIVALMAGREFERFHFDVNLVRGDDRAIERVRLARNPLAFAGEPPLVLPMIPPAQQLAEKLHAYTRSYGGQTTTRARDLFDMLVIPERVALPDAVELAAVCQDTFVRCRTSWPPTIDTPPIDWQERWAALLAEHHLRWVTLREAGEALRGFWALPISGQHAGQQRWDPSAWEWVVDQASRRAG